MMPKNDVIDNTGPDTTILPLDSKTARLLMTYLYMNITRRYNGDKMKDGNISDDPF